VGQIFYGGIVKFAAGYSGSAVKHHLSNHRDRGSSRRLVGNMLFYNE